MLRNRYLTDNRNYSIITKNMATEEINNDLPQLIVTVRLIRSFEYRNIRPVVFRDVDLDMQTNELKLFIMEKLKERRDLPPPVRQYNYDTLKIQHQAHGAKTNDPLINTEDDDNLILKPNQTLREAGVRHETEISFFNMKDYSNYKSCKFKN
ncbi:hypothetical protein CHUAL_007805 [Chamberlinius hualienensis]